MLWIDGNHDNKELERQDQVHSLQHFDDSCRRAAIEVIDIQENAFDGPRVPAAPVVTVRLTLVTGLRTVAAPVAEQISELLEVLPDVS